MLMCSLQTWLCIENRFVRAPKNSRPELKLAIIVLMGVLRLSCNHVQSLEPYSKEKLNLSHTLNYSLTRDVRDLIKKIIYTDDIVLQRLCGIDCEFSHAGNSQLCKATSSVWHMYLWGLICGGRIGCVPAFSQISRSGCPGGVFLLNCESLGAFPLNFF